MDRKLKLKHQFKLPVYFRVFFNFSCFYISHFLNGDLYLLESSTYIYFMRWVAVYITFFVLEVPRSKKKNYFVKNLHVVLLV